MSELTGSQSPEIPSETKENIFPWDSRNWDSDPIDIERDKIWDFLHRYPQNQEAWIAHIALSYYHDNPGTFKYGGVQAAWSQETIHPNDEYGYSLFTPEGQCGITNFGLGMVLAWSGVADLENIYYQEGSLLGVDGKLTGHHAWIFIDRGDGTGWRLDVTPFQYSRKNPDPDGDIRIALQSDSDHWTEFYPGINCRRTLQSEGTDKYSFIPVPNALSLTYQAETTTPLNGYDISKFNGRLELFMGRLGVQPGGNLAVDIRHRELFRLKNFWYPDAYDFELQNNVIGSPGAEDFENSLRLIAESDKTESHKSSLIAETYQLALDRMVGMSSLELLRTWTKECVDRAKQHMLALNTEDLVVNELVATAETIHERRDYEVWELEHDLHEAMEKTDDMVERAALSYLRSACCMQIVALPIHHIGFYTVKKVEANDVASYAALVPAWNGDFETYLAERRWQLGRLDELLIDNAGTYVKRRTDSPEKWMDLVNECGLLIEELTNKAMPQTLLRWVSECAERALEHFEMDYPYDSRLVKLRKKERKDPSWTHTDTLNSFGKAIFEGGQRYQKEGAGNAAFAAVVIHKLNVLKQNESDNYVTELRKQAFQAALFAAHAAAHDFPNGEEYLLEELLWQLKRLRELCDQEGQIAAEA
jgi:hypothetical protein